MVRSPEATAMQVGVGLSRLRDTKQAAIEATRMALTRAGCSEADFALVFATAAHAPRYAEMLAEITGMTEALVGCSGQGIITTDDEVEQAPAVGVLVLRGAGAAVMPFCIRDLRGRNGAVGRQIGRLVRAHIQSPSLLVLLPDTFSLQAPQLLSAIQAEAGRVPIVGGGASGDGTEPRTYQFDGGETVSDAVAGFALGDHVTVTIGIGQACRPIGEPMLVTRTQGSEVLELGGRAAYDVVADLIQAHETEVGNGLFVGWPADPAQTQFLRGEYVVRNIVGVNRDTRAIAVAEPIVEGRVVSFLVRDPDRAKAEMEEVVHELGQVHHGHPPRFGLYFNCCGRGSALYGRSGVDLALIRQEFGSIPLLGFFTYAELAPVQGINLLHNYTGVLVLVSEAR